MGSTPPRADGWTFDALADIDDDRHRYEVVGGLLVVSPRPTNLHMRVCRRLYDQLAPQCGPDWEAVFECGVRLGTDGRTADLGVVRRPSRTPEDAVGYEPGEIGLLVEVVSPSSRKTDRFLKPREYAAAGVPVYWRIETEPSLLVAAYRLESAAWVPTIAAGRGVVQLPGPVPLRVDVGALRV